GKLQLKDDATPRTDEITEYRITEHETRVTSPSDRNFLSIKDLYPGQYVTIEVMTGKEDQIVQKITTAFRPRAGYQEAYGRVQTIDEAGTLVLLERPPAGEAGEGNPISFVFYPKEIVVMRSPSRRPVQLLLKPGDVVKVEYVWHDEERQARTITVYSPQISSTTTTVTTTTTNTEGY
ncbi:MAG: hypothetical protein HGA80_09135, partial [Candidatus Omnitrophica bacterium]|nr:hypothetical protein [Candidatus Omnitrophota bacterium]